MNCGTVACSRVSARLVVYQISQLQLTALLQKVRQSCITVRYFLQIRSKISERRHWQVLCPCVVVKKPLQVYNNSNCAQQPSTKKFHRRCAATLKMHLEGRQLHKCTQECLKDQITKVIKSKVNLNRLISQLQVIRIDTT